MYIVLYTEGKHESIDRASVFTFGARNEADVFCKNHSTGKQKYWTNAEIVEETELIELKQPEE